MDNGELHLRQICLEYSFEQLEKCTNCFHESQKLGAGFGGTVYRGIMPDCLNVAIKVIDVAESPTGGFEDEIRVLSKFRHPNLVVLMGWAQQGTKRCLVYEFLSGGDVQHRLQACKQPGGKPFTWHERLSVALDAATGLAHLHNAEPHAFHRDIKTPNILIGTCCAKMADFGLACIAKTWKSLAVNCDMPSGTPGYCCPNYVATGKVTEGSEVYSFGMVLLELLLNQLVCGAAPDGSLVYPIQDMILPSLPNALQRCLEQADRAAGWPPHVVVQFANLALVCIAQEPQRPRFNDICRALRDMRDRMPQNAIGVGPHSSHAVPVHPQVSPPAGMRVGVLEQRIAPGVLMASGQGPAPPAVGTPSLRPSMMAPHGASPQLQISGPPPQILLPLQSRPIMAPGLQPSGVVVLQHQFEPRRQSYFNQMAPPNSTPHAALPHPAQGIAPPVQFFSNAMQSIPLRPPFVATGNPLAGTTVTQRFGVEVAVEPAQLPLVGHAQRGVVVHSDMNRTDGLGCRPTLNLIEDAHGIGRQYCQGAQFLQQVHQHQEQRGNQEEYMKPQGQQNGHKVASQAHLCYQTQGQSNAIGLPLPRVSKFSNDCLAAGMEIVVEATYAANADLSAWPDASRMLPASIFVDPSGRRTIEIGRQFQQQWFESLVDRAFLNCISRIACRISWGPHACKPLLRVEGSGPVLVDGVLRKVGEDMELKVGSAISLAVHNDKGEFSPMVVLTVNFDPAASLAEVSYGHAAPAAAQKVDEQPSPPIVMPTDNWQLECVAAPLPMDQFSALPRILEFRLHRRSSPIILGRANQPQLFQALLSNSSSSSLISRTHLQFAAASSEGGYGTHLKVTNIGQLSVLVDGKYLLPHGQDGVVANGQTLSFTKPAEGECIESFLTFRLHALSPSSDWEAKDDELGEVSCIQDQSGAREGDAVDTAMFPETHNPAMLAEAVFDAKTQCVTLTPLEPDLTSRAAPENNNNTSLLDNSIAPETEVTTPNVLAVHRVNSDPCQDQMLTATQSPEPTNTDAPLVKTNDLDTLANTATMPTESIKEGDNVLQSNHSPVVPNNDTVEHDGARADLSLAPTSDLAVVVDPLGRADFSLAPTSDTAVVVDPSGMAPTTSGTVTVQVPCCETDARESNNADFAASKLDESEDNLGHKRSMTHSACHCLRSLWIRKREG